MLISQSLPGSSGFVVPTVVQHQPSCCNRQRQVVQSSQQSSQTHEFPAIRPVFVNDELAFMGATLALHTYDVLRGSIQIPTTDGALAATTPKDQPVFLVADQKILQQQIDSFKSRQTILHIAPGPNRIQLNHDILQRISYAGFYLTAGVESQKGRVSPDQAKGCAEALGQILQMLPPLASTKNQGPRAFVSLDAPLHLAILQVNGLPKTPVLAHNDAYYVMLPNGDSVLVDYLYDSEKPGGCDPLSCQTKEVFVETSPTPPSSQRSIVQSAAYSSLRGNSVDPVKAAAIAASVATVLGDSNFTSGPISWSDIKNSVQLTRHISQFGTKKTTGMLRKKYVEYGYK